MLEMVAPERSDDKTLERSCPQTIELNLQRFLRDTAVFTMLVSCSGASHSSPAHSPA
jgi:hypothetical protein